MLQSQRHNEFSTAELIKIMSNIIDYYIPTKFHNDYSISLKVLFSLEKQFPLEAR